LNLAELYYILLNQFGRQTADYWYGKFHFDLAPLSKDVIKKAASFRFANKKKNLSLVDCVGYMLALEHKLSFLQETSNLKA